MRLPTATTVLLSSAASITLSAGAVVKRDCAIQTGQIYLGNSTYLSAYALQRVVFAQSSNPEDATVFQFQDCGDTPFEISYFNGTQIGGLLGAALYDVTNADNFDIDYGNLPSAFLAQVPHSDQGVVETYDAPTWLPENRVAYSQSKIWNYDASTAIISATWIDQNGDPADTLVTTNYTEFLGATTLDSGIINSVAVSPITLFSAELYPLKTSPRTFLTMTWVSVAAPTSPTSSTLPPTSSSSSTSPTSSSSSSSSASASSGPSSAPIPSHSSTLSTSSSSSSSSSSSTSSSSTSSPQPSATGSLAGQSLYDQCGGRTWTGSRHCASGLVCISEGDYYSQCYTLDPNTVLNADGTTGDGSSSQPTQTIYGQCGGAGWTGLTQCGSGLVCVAQNSNPGYSQCLTLDPDSVPSRSRE